MSLTTMTDKLARKSYHSTTTNVPCEADDEETMTLEEARAILHKTVREEYARP